MIKQGEGLHYIGRLKYRAIDGGDQIVIEDLEPYQIHISLQRYGKEIMRLPIVREESLFRGTIDGETTKKLTPGEYQIEAAIVENGEVIVADNYQSVVIGQSILGELIKSEKIELELEGENLSESEIDDPYAYTLELELLNVNLDLTRTEEVEDALLFGFGRVIKGPRGKSAYEVAVDNGFVGNEQEWVLSLKGESGSQGQSGISIEWMGTLQEPPLNPSKNSVYKDSDDGRIYIFDGEQWSLMVLDGNDGINGTDGDDGYSVYITYHASNTKPIKPSGEGNTGGWYTNPDEYVIWMSQKVAESVLLGEWSEPIRLRGLDGVDGLNGADGVNGADGTTLVWKGTLEEHPENPQDGWAYYNSVDHKSYVYQDGAWYQMTIDGVDGNSSFAVYTYADTMPSVPENPTTSIVEPWSRTRQLLINERDITISGEWSKIDGWWKSNEVTHLQQTKLRMDFFAPQASVLSISTKVSSESNYDFLRIGYLNREVTTTSQIDMISGNQTYNNSFDVAQGENYIEFIYTKDTSGSTGDDAGYVKINGGDLLWVSMVEFDGTYYSYGTPFLVSGEDGISIVWKGDCQTPPENPQINWVYRDTDNARVYIYNGTAWELMVLDGNDGVNGTNGVDGVDGTDGINGKDGAYYSWIYKLSDDSIQPTGGSFDGTDEVIPEGWSDDPIYSQTSKTQVSKCRYVQNDQGEWVMDGQWSMSVQYLGTDGMSVYITYHAGEEMPDTPTGDGTSDGWYTNPDEFTVWMSQKVAHSAISGVWGTPIKIKGTDGSDADISAVDYLKTALVDGSSGMYGGLLLSDFVAVQDQDDNIVAGINGGSNSQTQQLPFLFAGAQGGSLNDIKNAPFFVGQDGTTYIRQGEFSGGLKTKFFPLNSSNATYIESCKYKIADKLNISISRDDMEGEFPVTMVLPNDSEFLGANVNISMPYDVKSRSGVTDFTTNVIPESGCYMISSTYAGANNDFESARTVSQIEFCSGVISFECVPAIQFSPTDTAEVAWVCKNYPGEASIDADEGYAKFPNGMMIQWGKRYEQEDSTHGESGTLTFPLAFKRVYNVQCMPIVDPEILIGFFIIVSSMSNGSFTYKTAHQVEDGLRAGFSEDFSWMAIGSY